MIRPATKHTIEILGGVVAVLAVAAIALSVALARGPISLNFLAPTLSNIMSDSAGDYDVRIAEAEVFWSEQGNGLQLRARGVQFIDAHGDQAAKIPDLQIGLSSLGLRQGRFEPAAVRISAAEATIHRDLSGRFSIGSASPDATSTPDHSASSAILPVIMSWISNDQSEITAGAYLNQIQIENARLVFKDERTGIDIVAPQSQLVLNRKNGGVDGTLHAEAFVGDDRVLLNIDIDYEAARRTGLADVRFSPVVISHLAPLSSFLEPFGVFDLPVSGLASIHFGAGGIVDQAQLSLHGGKGRFALPVRDGIDLDIDTASLNANYYPGTGHVELEWFRFDGPGGQGTITGTGQLVVAEQAPLKHQSAWIKLTGNDVRLASEELFDDAFEMPRMFLSAEMAFGTDWRVAIKTADLALGGGNVVLSGEIEAGAGSPAIYLDGFVSDFEAANLGNVWPKGVIPPARNWVVPHVHSGRLTKGVLQVRAPEGAFASKPPLDSAISFEFEVEDGVASYVTGLPPLSETKAFMRLTGQTFNLELESAKILGTELTSGSVEMNALGVRSTPIDIAAAGVGPVVDLMKIIDAEPLGFISAYGASPDDFGGTADLNFTMRIPQQSKIDVDDVAFTVDAKAHDIVLPPVGEVALDDGVADVTVTETGLKAVGTIHANGVAANIEYKEKFRGRGETPSTYHIKTALDDGARASLGLNTGDPIIGTIPVEVVAHGNGTKVAHVAVDANLDEVDVSLPQLGLTKLAGDPLKAHADIRIADDGAVELSKFLAKGREINVSASAKLAASGQLVSADVPVFVIPEFADAKISVGRQDNDGVAINLSGAMLNAEPLLKELLKDRDQKSSLPWQVNADLDQLKLREGVSVRNMRFTAVSDEGNLNYINSAGKFDEGGDYIVTLAQTGKGAQMLSLDSSNGGLLVRGLTGVDTIRGGDLSVSLQFKDRDQDLAAAEDPANVGPVEPAGTSQAAVEAARIAQSRNGEINGVVKLNDFMVVDLPILARLLNIGSLQGLGDLLQGEGISFSRLEMPIWVDDELIGFDNGQASGPALGLTVHGVVDRKREVADLRGSIVPAYTLNSVLGNVPLVGPLLISREGEGIIGFTYGVEGPLEEPQLFVNPLAALAPGFLRRLFEMDEAEARRTDNPAKP